jgi:hypothetical protein
MKAFLLIFAFAANLCLGNVSRALSTGDLVRYLGIHSWTTVVDLPPKTFSADIYELINGRIGARIFQGSPEWETNPKSKLTIMVGCESGKYRIVTAYGDGPTWGLVTSKSIFSGFISASLPPRIKEGDYVLFGNPRTHDPRMNTSAASSYKEGFVLRIVKKH